MSWLDGFTMFKDPAVSNSLVNWTKTQPGYKNWDGKPIAPTLAEDRKLITDLNSYAPNPADSNFNFSGVKAPEYMGAAQTQVDQRNALLNHINTNPTMTGDQLTPGLDAIKAQYGPKIMSQNRAISAKSDRYQDKKLNPGGFWGAMNKIAPIAAGAALSGGVGAMAGGGILGSALGSAVSQGVFPYGGSGHDSSTQASSPKLGAQQPAPQLTSQPSALNVAQMYRDVLGREPESQQAVDYWTQQFGPTFGAEDKTAFTQAASPELAAKQAAALRGQTPTATPQPNGMPAPVVT